MDIIKVVVAVIAVVIIIIPHNTVSLLRNTYPLAQIIRISLCVFVYTGISVFIRYM